MRDKWIQTVAKPVGSYPNFFGNFFPTYRPPWVSHPPISVKIVQKPAKRIPSPEENAA